MNPPTPPRIAFNAALLREPYSGVEVMIHETACALVAHGTLPGCIYTPRRGSRPIPANGRVQLRAVAANPTRLQRILWEQCKLPQLLRRDSIHLLHAPAYIAPLLAPCLVVLTLHDLHVYTHPHFCTAANRLHYRLLLPLSIRRAAALIVYSEHVRHALLKRFPAVAAKTRVIPPGVPAGFGPPATAAQRDAVRRRLNLPPRFVLFVGNLAPRKNLPAMLAAFDQLRASDRDLHLVLAGAPCGAPGNVAACPQVHQLGYAPPADLPALYAMADALIFPSLDEGFGLPALEAMACGCPVICSPGGAAEVCADAALLCDPAAPGSIAAAVQTLQRDPAQRQARINAGLRRANAFQWKVTVQKTEALYRELLAD